MMRPHSEDMQINGPDSTDHTKNAGDGLEISLPKHNCPINDKAEQAGEKSSSSPESQKNGDPTPCAFPQFMQLPPELRYHIWKSYCPDLAKSRVLQFNFVGKKRLGLCVVPDRTMVDQTESLRIVLSTHSESRNLALRQYPDELALIAGVADGIIRFRKETDIISLRDWAPDVTSMTDWTPRGKKKYFMPDFSDRIENLALEPIQIPYRETIFDTAPLLRLTFPNLKRLFKHYPFLEFVSSLKNWCFTNIAHAYVVETHKRANGKGLDSKFMFCWPDLDGFADFAKCLANKRLEVTPEKMKNGGLEVWPVVEFGSQEQINTYERMRGYDYEEVRRSETPEDMTKCPFDLTGFLPGDNDNNAIGEADDDDLAIEEADDDDLAIEEADNDDLAIEGNNNDNHNHAIEAPNNDMHAIVPGPQDFEDEFETIEDELDAFYNGLSEDEMVDYVMDVIRTGNYEARFE
ncbi:hypothetical protein E4U56_003350 [Claviceps arundinis]|uniref:2EXR domain-containing protein n=1 Tax=Claviceps arundinis TaxID=1623583 RepID=A0A9P7SRW9_9HYPO|nr:hypothetical protein E4U56_003350 [Claviceps arundinis]